MKLFAVLSFLIGLLGGADIVLASVSKPSVGHTQCQALKEELKAMQQAQQSILNSMVNNHQTFAVTLEEYSSSAVAAPKVTSQEMKRSAQSFRSRGVQGKKMVQKLNQASSDLIARVASCLK